MINMLKELYKTLYFDTSKIKIGLKMGKLRAFKYLQMGCNRSDHIVGFVPSCSLIKYV